MSFEIDDDGRIKRARIAPKHMLGVCKVETALGPFFVGLFVQPDGDLRGSVLVLSSDDARELAGALGKWAVEVDALNAARAN